MNVWFGKDACELKERSVSLGSESQVGGHSLLASTPETEALHVEGLEVSIVN